MPLIGYARMSTKDQTPLPQVQALTVARCAQIHGAALPSALTSPCSSIFDTGAEIMVKHGLRAIRCLAANTMTRVAHGMKRCVIVNRPGSVGDRQLK